MGGILYRVFGSYLMYKRARGIASLKRDEIICFGAVRDVEAAGAEADAAAVPAGRAEPSVRGRFFGRASASRSWPVDAAGVEVERASCRALRFSTRFAFTLQVSYSP